MDPSRPPLREAFSGVPRGSVRFRLALGTTSPTFQLQILSIQFEGKGVVIGIKGG